MTRSRESAEGDTPDRAPFPELDEHVIFTNKSVFDIDYIPDRIFVRKEFDPIVRFYFDAIKFQLQQTMIIVGPSGSGKTLACRYYGAEAIRYARQKETALSYIYVNCREIGAPYAFWQAFLDQLKAPAPKGLSLTDLLTRLAKAIEDRRHVVVVLDEIEKLFSRVGNGPANDILYNLARLRANRNLDTAISSILITNSAHLTRMFDAPVKSSLNTTHLVIGPYGTDELTGILTDRAKAGLKEGTWSSLVINYVAAKTAQCNSDARFAIRLIKNVACELEASGGSEITTNQVDDTFDATRREMETEVLHRLSASQLMVLLALATKAQEADEPFIGLHQVYKGPYPIVCKRHGWKPLVYSHFLHTVNVLQSHDLVNNMLERRRRGGFVRMVEVNLSPADVIREAEAALQD